MRIILLFKGPKGPKGSNGRPGANGGHGPAVSWFKFIIKAETHIILLIKLIMKFD